MSNRETSLLAEIRIALGKHASHTRLFRNPRGLFWAGKLMDRKGSVVVLQHAQQIECGLCDGASDLIGWTTIEITPEMVGRKIAVFTSPEVKVPGASRRETQFTWRNNVLEAGGIAGIVKTPQECVDLVKALPPATFATGALGEAPTLLSPRSRGRGAR
jgi:hypothetical protein